MHGTQILQVAQNSGEQPVNWRTGDDKWKKAMVVAAAAHHATKSPADPELPACDLTYQEKCSAVVESLLDGNKPDDTPFAQAAYQLLKEIDANGLSRPSSA